MTYIRPARFRCVLKAASRMLSTARIRSAAPLAFFGLPPFAPFARAASAFASERTLPPLRPSATAAGFLRGTADSQRLGAQRPANCVGGHRNIVAPTGLASRGRDDLRRHVVALDARLRHAPRTEGQAIRVIAVELAFHLIHRGVRLLCHRNSISEPLGLLQAKTRRRKAHIA